MIKLLRSKRGFTLVEIMIVVAIIGLLAAIAIPNFIKSRSRSRDAVCANGMKQIASALEQVCMEEDLDATGGGAGIAAIVWNALPVTGTWGIVGSAAYLKTAPACPIAAGAYTVATNAIGVFQITCPNLASHGPKFIADNTPFTL